MIEGECFKEFGMNVLLMMMVTTFLSAVLYVLRINIDSFIIYIISQTNLQGRILKLIIH